MTEILGVADTLRSTFTADRKPRFEVCRLPFAVCGMSPSCIKNRVITTRGNKGNQPKQTWRLHEGKWNCYLFFLSLIPSKSSLSYSSSFRLPTR